MEEIWKDVQGYEGYYQVSNIGRVKSFSRKRIMPYGGIRVYPEKILNPNKNRYGYITTVLTKNSISKTFTVHRLVAKAFLPNPENKHQVNHINGIKTDNHLENLEWVNQSENQFHAFNNKLQISIKGEKHYASKLTEKQVLEIKYGNFNISTYKIAKLYNVCQSAICSIKKNKTWKHL